MKTTFSVRFPEDMSRALQWVQKREGGEVSDAVRRLLRKGLEREVADAFSQGGLTLREAAQILSMPLIEALDLLQRQGVPGNVTMEQALDSRKVADVLAGQSPAITRSKRGARR